MNRCPVDTEPNLHFEVMQGIDRLRTRINDEFWLVEAVTLDGVVAEIERLAEDYQHLIPAGRIGQMVTNIEALLDEDERASRE
jgi:hypothetical protein